MNEIGSGGIGAISIGVNGWVVLVIVPLLAFGVWKIAKLIWAALS